MPRDVIFVTVSLANMAGGIERNITGLSSILSESYRVQLVSFDWPGAHSFFEVSEKVMWHKIAVSEPHSKIGFSIG